MKTLAEVAFNGISDSRARTPLFFTPTNLDVHVLSPHHCRKYKYDGAFNCFQFQSDYSIRNHECVLFSHDSSKTNLQSSKNQQETLFSVHNNQ